MNEEKIIKILRGIIDIFEYSPLNENAKKKRYQFPLKVITSGLDVEKNIGDNI